tara:strand:+ start:204 stop:419 length:216 start_codon:yes stop_codon:yes gene_type:complete
MKYLYLLSLLLFSTLFAVYEVGEQISSADQNISFDICSGDYPTSTLSLSDFNGDLNGGNYKVIHIDMSASW